MMGVSLYATNSKYSFEMGYGGFFNLRKNIAYAVDIDLGDIYERMLWCSSEDFDKYCSIVNKMIDDKKLDSGIIYFLFLPDAEGSVDYKICKSIYNAIRDINFGDKGFQYVSYRRGNDYEMFKMFLLDCYRHRRKMRWA